MCCNVFFIVIHVALLCRILIIFICICRYGFSFRCATCRNITTRKDIVFLNCWLRPNLFCKEGYGDVGIHVIECYSLQRKCNNFWRVRAHPDKICLSGCALANMPPLRFSSISPKIIRDARYLQLWSNSCEYSKSRYLCCSIRIFKQQLRKQGRNHCGVFKAAQNKLLWVRWDVIKALCAYT